MKRSRDLSYAVHWFAKKSSKPSAYLSMSFLLICLVLSACSGPFGGDNSSHATPTAKTQAGNQLKWCGKATMVFRDEGVGTPNAAPGTPQTVTDWSVVKANLGFTIYLPGTLPTGTCLVSAQATIHDGLFGGSGSFTIGYLLPDHSALSISEAPLKTQSVSFQCSATTTNSTPKTATPTASASPTPSPNQLCSGAKNTTNIILSGPGTTDHLQQIFTNLQPDVNWIPEA